uniref:S-RNase n=3 Tax=Malus domestica TaxID=3750 RepID=O22474_MALDO|nr:S27-RNase [Malus domestica]AAK58853.1 self-incompatibility S-RNase [Malus domestica]AWL24797.1 S-RNase [Malus domestica]
MGITGMISMITMVFSLLVLILSSSTVGFDYFQFTQQYQPAVCNFNPTPCKDPTDKLFTVHGLWPSNNVGGDPESCKIRNHRTRAKALEPQLEIIWPNVLDRTNHTAFWRRQWIKHGTCGYPTIQNENDYFETVVKMYITEKQNVSKILSNAKIEPDGIKRTLADLEIAIRSGTDNKKPKFKCQKKRRVTELVEVTLCSDKNRAHFIDCPNPFQPGSPYLCPTNNILY